MLAWTLCAVLAVVFAASGLSKIVGVEEVLARFARWEYSESFRLFVGFCELAGAVGLLWPRLSLSACAGLSGLMLGAVYTHLLHAEPPWIALATLGLVIATAWLRRHDAFFTRAVPLQVSLRAARRRAA